MACFNVPGGALEWVRVGEAKVSPTLRFLVVVGLEFFLSTAQLKFLHRRGLTRRSRLSTKEHVESLVHRLKRR
jgi:hypothetical protein